MFAKKYPTFSSISSSLYSNYSREKISQQSESIKILLRSHYRIFMLIIPAFYIHIIHHPDGQQIQVPDRQPQLHAPQEEQGRCHFPVSRTKFFLACTSVWVFSPHSSMIWGST